MNKLKNFFSILSVVVSMTACQKDKQYIVVHDNGTSEKNVTSPASTVVATEQTVNLPYTCRQCGKSIPWVGSYWWNYYAGDHGTPTYDIQQIKDASYENDERINTELFKDEGMYSRGIFCSEQCATYNADAFEY